MSSRRLLVINPNTDTRVTGWLAAAARHAAGPEWEIEAVNAASGLAALVTPQHVASAAMAVVDEVEARLDVQGVLIGAFGDPGLAEIRRRAPSRRLVGLGEAGLHAAAAGSRRFAIVTLGAAMDRSVRERVGGMGFGNLLTGVTILPVLIEHFVISRDAHVDVVAAAVRHSFEHEGAQAVLLGGAPFAGLGMQLEPRFHRPVLDGVAAAVAALHG